MGITKARQNARERQKARRERMKAAGFVQVSAWVHRDDRDKFNRYVAKLLAGRNQPE